MPTFEPTTPDTATVAVNFAITASAAPTSDDEDALKQQAALRAGVGESALKNFAVAVALARRLSGGNNVPEDARRLPTTYSWAVSFEVAVDLTTIAAASPVAFQSTLAAEFNDPSFALALSGAIGTFSAVGAVSTAVASTRHPTSQPTADATSQPTAVARGGRPSEDNGAVMTLIVTSAALGGLLLVALALFKGRVLLRRWRHKEDDTKRAAGHLENLEGGLEEKGVPKKPEPSVVAATQPAPQARGWFRARVSTETKPGPESARSMPPEPPLSPSAEMDNSPTKTNPKSPQKTATPQPVPKEVTTDAVAKLPGTALFSRQIHERSKLTGEGPKRLGLHQKVPKGSPTAGGAAQPSPRSTATGSTLSPLAGKNPVGRALEPSPPKSATWSHKASRQRLEGDSGAGVRASGIRVSGESDTWSRLSAPPPHRLRSLSSDAAAARHVGAAAAKSSPVHQRAEGRKLASGAGQATKGTKSTKKVLRTPKKERAAGDVPSKFKKRRAPRERKPPGPGPLCPGGSHRLVPYRTAYPDYTCSVCNKPFPDMTRMFGCRACDYDLCEACVPTAEVGMPKEPPREVSQV